MVSILDRIRRVIRPGGGVEEQAVQSGVLIMATNIGDRLIQLSRTLVLASLLSPADFGLFGIAGLALTALDRFTHLGLDKALIQRVEEDIDAFLDTVFFLRIGRSVIIAIIALLAAPLVASFFGEPRATLLLRFIALVSIVGSLQNPGVVYFQKNLDFHKEFIHILGGTLSSAVVAISVALVSPTVWSLAFGSAAGTVAGLVISYAIHDFRPGLNFDADRAQEMLGYGRWITGSSIISYLVTKGDDLLVGRVLGAGSLGLYDMAFRLANAPATEFAETLNRALRPSFSKIQTEQERLENVFERSLILVASVSFPMSLGILAVTEPFTKAFLGSEWVPMIPVMQIFAVIVVLRAIPSPLGAILDGTGHPDIKTKSQFAGLVLMAILIYPAIMSFGLVGAAVATGARFVASTPISYYVAVKRLELSRQGIIRAIIYPAVASTVMLAVVLSIQYEVVFASHLMEFAVSVAVGVVAYAVLILLFDRYFGYDILDIARSIRGSMSG